MWLETGVSVSPFKPLAGTASVNTCCRVCAVARYRPAGRGSSLRPQVGQLTLDVDALITTDLLTSDHSHSLSAFCETLCNNFHH